MRSGSGTIQDQAKTSKVQTNVEPPEDSFLLENLKQHPRAIHDCFGLDIRNSTHSRSNTTALDFCQSFFSSDAFAFESIILRTARWCFPRTQQDPNQKQEQLSFGSGFFVVSQQSTNQIILDSGPFFSWLAVYPSATVTKYRFGSIIKEPNWFLRRFMPIHLWYSKFLLAGAVRHHETKK